MRYGRKKADIAGFCRRRDLCKYRLKNSEDSLKVAVDCLEKIEMVKAYDSQQLKKANKIGQMLCKSMQNDSKNNMYSSYIG